MNLKILIVDDELSIGKHLKSIIEEVPEVKVVYVAASGAEAIRKAAIFRPRVVFLDVDMPEMNGLEVARTLAKMDEEIYFVFVTAFPDYALQAFELYSFDYILKPFSEDRVKKTVRKLRDKLIQHSPSPTLTDSIKVKIGDKTHFIKPEQILYIESIKSRKILIKTLNKGYEVTGEIHTLEEKLKQFNFFRCHRAYLINLNFVSEIIPFGRSFQILLSTGDVILLSRQHEKSLRSLLGLNRRSCSN